MKILNLTDTAKNVLKIEADAILRIRDNLDEIEFSKAIDAIYNCKGRVIVTGMGKSGHIGRKIAASLASTGTPSFFVHPAEASHGDLGMITEDDVVVAISNSGESRELIDILNYCKRFGIKLIAITKNAESSSSAATSSLYCTSVFRNKSDTSSCAEISAI